MGGAEGLTISLYINHFVTSNCDMYIYKHIYYAHLSISHSIS